MFLSKANLSMAALIERVLSMFFLDLMCCKKLNSINLFNT